MTDITLNDLNDEWCEYCMSYKLSEPKIVVDGHHYEKKTLVLHVKNALLCLDCGNITIINNEPFYSRVPLND